jgi:hypothetical protein
MDKKIVVVLGDQRILVNDLSSILEILDNVYVAGKPQKTHENVATAIRTLLQIKNIISINPN